MEKFNLEKALLEWKKQLNKYQGFEPGTAEELYSHATDAIEDLMRAGKSGQEAFESVTKQRIGDLEKLSQEYYKAKSMKSSPPSNDSSSLAGNFLKVAFRNIIKSRPHSFINLTGLCIGLASVIVISLYVFSELNFDKFHRDNERIYRIVNKLVRSETVLNYVQAPPGLTPALKTNFPELEQATRLRIADRPLIKYQDNTYYEDHVFYADSSFLKIFDFELISGNRNTALNQPNQVVITENLATKYFGNEDPINKILLLDGTRPMQVSGVMRNVPHQSHLYFEMLISFETYIVPNGYLENLDSWVWMGFITYAKTYPGVNIPDLEEKIKKQYASGDERWSKMDVTIDLQPLTDIYLGSAALSNLDNVFRVNSYTTLYSLMIVGGLIILIASFNYINLSVAMSMARFKEIAMRKVLGSSKAKLILQFVMESALYALIALVIAILLVMLGVRLAPENIASQISIGLESLIYYGAVLILFTMLLGVISGLAPALRLASVTSLDLLKGTYKLKSGNLKNVLIGFQFALSASLIAISLVIGKQIEFFSTKSLGFIKDGVVAINMSSDQIRGSQELIKNKVKSLAGINEVSISSHVVGEGLSGSPLYLSGLTAEDAIQMAYLQSDYDFVKTMGLELVAGRYFSEEFKQDSARAIILNETAVNALGLSDPIGEKVIFIRGEEREIIGVLKDFHFNTLHQKIEPMAIIMPYGVSQTLMVRMDGNQVYNTLSGIENTWHEMFPDIPFEFKFMDDFHDSLYQKEKAFSIIIQFFTILATAIACLGLYSLAAISLGEKLKQISIRRVLGAPVGDIIMLNAKGFVFLVVVSCILSWPLVYYVMNEWLSNFAYHIDLSVWFFLLTFWLIVFITIVTLSYHMYKAVTINPAEILRDN